MGYIGILLAVTFVFSTAGLFAFVWSLSSKTSQAQRHNAEVSAPANLVGMACASRMTERSIAWRSNWGGVAIGDEQREYRHTQGVFLVAADGRVLACESSLNRQTLVLAIQEALQAHGAPASG